MAPITVCGHSRGMSEPHVPVTVFLVDDSPLICERVAAMLAGDAVSVVGQAATPQTAIDGILALEPNVVVLDVQLEGGSGLDVLRVVHPALPKVAFVVFSSNSGPAYRKRYLHAGALRFLDKSSEFDQLAQAVVHAAQPATR